MLILTLLVYNFVYKAYLMNKNALNREYNITEKSTIRVEQND